MLNEISQAVKYKYHIISPLTGTQSIEEKNKQNTTRDIEVGNSLAVAKGEWGGNSGKRGLQELL